MRGVVKVENEGEPPVYRLGWWHDRERKPGWVYRCFDAEGRLIYVGSSTDVDSRMKTHRDKWWIGQVARVEREAFPTMNAAAAREAETIRDECPRWNVQGKRRDTAESVRDLITTLERGNASHTSYTKWWIEKLRTDLRALEADDAGTCPHCGQQMPEVAA